MDYYNKIQEATTFIKSKIDELPEFGLILGSGLGPLADEIETPIKLTYEEIPHFPVSTVAGHKGQLVLGTLNGKKVLAMQGRFHFYEGYTMQELTLPVRVMKELGIETIFVTNACGAINPDFYPGALMLISDHLNLMGANPLIGSNVSQQGPRFPDMSSAYSPELREIGRKVAKQLGIEVFEGVYAAVSGPYYLSKAELKMVRTLGSDTIGMSTIPEVIVARHCGIRALGISCVTDMAVPEQLEHLDHSTVVEVANKTRPKFISLVKGILKEI